VLRYYIIALFQHCIIAVLRYFVVAILLQHTITILQTCKATDNEALVAMCPECTGVHHRPATHARGQKTAQSKHNCSQTKTSASLSICTSRGKTRIAGATQT